MKFEPLEWDSNFFHFKICKITSPIKNIEELRMPDSIGEFKLAYYSSDEALEFAKSDNKEFEIKLVDKKTTFLKQTNGTLQYHPAIISYEYDLPSPKLFELAIQSGVYSRFNIDERIGRNKYEELYRLWITRLVKREMAKEVLVYMEGNDIAGFLTVGEKNGRAELGMGAVDIKYRGKGIGRSIFLHAEKWAYDHGYDSIQIVTQGENKAACNLYESIGYHIESVEYFYHIWRR